MLFSMGRSFTPSTCLTPCIPNFGPLNPCTHFLGKLRSSIFIFPAAARFPITVLNSRGRLGSPRFLMGYAICIIQCLSSVFGSCHWWGGISYTPITRAACSFLTSGVSLGTGVHVPVLCSSAAAWASVYPSSHEGWIV